ncbi:MAG: YHS domain-containing protein [Verrucomicrobiaceae bacterium]
MKITLFIAGISLTLVSCQHTGAAPEPAASSPVASASPAPAPSHPTPPKIKPYPLDKCLVTDEPLDEWDEMQTTVYQGQEMKFCCKMCLKKFNKDPDKYLALLPND